MKSRHFIADNNYTFEVEVVEHHDNGTIARAEVVATIPLQGTTLDHLNHIGNALAQYAIDIADVGSFGGIRVELARPDVFYVIADIYDDTHERTGFSSTDRYCLIQLDCVPVPGHNTYIVPTSWVATKRFESVVHFDASALDFMAKEHEAVVFKPGCVSNCVDDIYTTANILYDLYDEGWLTQDWSAAFRVTTLTDEQADAFVESLL